MKKNSKYQVPSINSIEVHDSPFQRLTFSNSFEEMDDENRLSWIMLSPEERVSQATLITKEIFSGTKILSTKKQRIIFDQL
jgi:hypothetical protein